jgi:hypothetical protein
MGCIGALFRVPFGAILGYLVIAALIIAGLAAVVAFAGVAFCFEGDSWVGSERFLLATLGVSAVAALLGGFTAMRIGGSLAILLLCLLVGVLGSLSALGMLGQADEYRLRERPEERPDDLGPLQAVWWSENTSAWEWGNVAVCLAGIAVGAAVGKGAPRESTRGRARNERD